MPLACVNNAGFGASNDRVAYCIDHAFAGEWSASDEDRIYILVLKHRFEVNLHFAPGGGQFSFVV